MRLLAPGQRIFIGSWRRISAVFFLFSFVERALSTALSAAFAPNLMREQVCGPRLRWELMLPGV